MHVAARPAENSESKLAATLDPPSEELNAISVSRNAYF